MSQTDTKQAENRTHEFQRGNFGPTTVPLCSVCGLSAQAETHKIHGWFITGSDDLRQKNAELKQQRDEALSALADASKNIGEARRQRDELLAACALLCDLLDRNEIEIPSSVLKLKFAEPGLFKAAIARAERRAE